MYLDHTTQTSFIVQSTCKLQNEQKYTNMQVQAKYVYTGELDLENLSGEDTLGLLIASDELLFEEIFKHVQDHLISNQDCWILQNFTSNSNIAEWDQEKFEALQETLDPFIPLIRFAEIPPADFFDKVRPYKAAISYQIYEQIEEYHYKKSFKPTLLPTRVENLESSIIKPKLVTIISNWIEKNDSNVFSSNNRYRFNLIYSSTRDGFNCNTFNIKCNKQGPFVVLIKVQSKEIYGGYNPIGYELRDGKWLNSSDSFIFSFENDQDSHNMKMSRVINVNKSIYEHRDGYFINFGDCLYIEERQKLYLRKNVTYCSIRNNVNCTLPIEEIEAFSVEKK
ncbi:4509_t:CDS:2 [Funneliformis mosseae]|uniref:4509_t:CDS:1 n=1 Tax=Funneliformis mosseae TaxID=27381 RepID=A0A9N8VF10_FUNMO|nr:4509_t:CDS:2 [Funneliformis mosseae]